MEPDLPSSQRADGSTLILQDLSPRLMVLLFWMWGPVPIFFFFIMIPAIGAAVVAADGGDIPFRFFLVVALSGTAACTIYRSLTVRAVIAPDRIIIRNPLRTHAISGSELERLAYTKVGEGRTQSHLIGVRTKGKRTIPIAAAFYATRKRRAEAAERIRHTLPRAARSWDLDAYVEDGGLG